MPDHLRARLRFQILDFDGHVLEIFGPQGSIRLPASELGFSRSQPERRRGRVTLQFDAFGQFGASLVVEPEELEGVDAFLAGLEAAGVPRG